MICQRKLAFVVGENMAKEFYTEEQYKDGIVEKPKRKNFRDMEGTMNGKITVLGWADLKLIFGCKYSVGKILKKYGTVKGWLEYEYLLDEYDHFEEILFERKHL